MSSNHFKISNVAKTPTKLYARRQAVRRWLAGWRMMLLPKSAYRLCNYIVVQPVVQPAGRNVLNTHSIKHVTSTVHTAALQWRNNVITKLLNILDYLIALVISVRAGPLKRRLAGLICIVHPTGCATGCKYVLFIRRARLDDGLHESKMLNSYNRLHRRLYNGCNV